MSKSLQDQLLKAGLVDNKQIQNVRKEQRKKNKSSGKKTNTPIDENKIRAQQGARDKAERDRQLNLQRKEDSERKAKVAQALDLINKNKLDRTNADHTYQFIHNNKVRSILVTDSMRKQLSADRLAIVKARGEYELVSIEISEKIKARDASIVISIAGTSTSSPIDGDPYADYQVPDDLIW